MLKDDILNSIDHQKMKCAFVIKNLRTGEFVSFNENKIVPSASLIKIPIMAEIMRQSNINKISLKQRITIGDDVKVPFSILTMLDSENHYTINDIMTLMIIQSDNTAANILIDIAGIDNINNFIKVLGLNDTILQRKMMDFDARNQGKDNLTTASDMAKMLELLYKGEVIDKKSSDYMIDIMKNQLDTSVMMRGIPDGIAAAHKTGELYHIQYDAGIVYLDNMEYIFCVLVWDAISNNFAKKTIGRISDITYNYFIKGSGSVENY